MKKFMLCAVLTCAALLADVTGKWSGTAEINTDGQQSKDATALELKQTGNDVTGTAGANGEFRIKKGTVDGDTIKLEVEAEGNVYYIVLTVDGDHMTGKASADPEGKQVVAKVQLEREK